MRLVGEFFASEEMCGNASFAKASDKNLAPEGKLNVQAACKRGVFRIA
jgi:hypothetical protein